jgi:hypothetical protein
MRERRWLISPYINIDREKQEEGNKDYGYSIGYGASEPVEAFVEGTKIIE